MPERPRFSRFRRLPGLYRIGEHKLPDPHEEPLPLTVYLPGRILDVAEELAARHGFATTQEYCEQLLKSAIEDEQLAAKAEAVQVTHGTLSSLDELADDPDYLAEWTASRLAEPAPEPAPSRTEESPAMDETTSFARAAILRHAGLGGEDQAAFLPILRRGEVVPQHTADELLGALADLEMRLVGTSSLDRRLAYALHRLAFEGQVLVTDGATEAGADPATIDRLRRVQEGVDRVLSGEDVRYFPTPSDHG